MKRSRSNLANQYRFCYTDNGAQPSLQYNNVSSSSRSPLRLVWPVPAGTVSQDESLNAQLASIIAEIQAREKKLIGQELHDNVNQILSMVKLFIEMLKLDDEKNKDIQKRSIQYLMEAITEIRKISGELVAPKKQNTGQNLVDTIRTIVDDINFSTKIKIKLVHSGDVECLSQDKKTAIVRIVQEQLKNILKYSKAKNVLVNINLQNNEVVLSIKDDGVGFDPQARHTGIGLSNITDRTQLYNGTVQLQTSKGKGCSLNVSIPAA